MTDDTSLDHEAVDVPQAMTDETPLDHDDHDTADPCCPALPPLQQSEECSFQLRQASATAAASLETVNMAQHYDMNNSNDDDDDVPELKWDDGSVSQVFSSSERPLLPRSSTTNNNNYCQQTLALSTTSDQNTAASPFLKSSQHAAAAEAPRSSAPAVTLPPRCQLPGSSNHPGGVGSCVEAEEEGYRAQPMKRFGCGMIPRFRSKPRNKHFDASSQASEASLSSLHDLGTSSIANFPRDSIDGIPEDRRTWPARPAADAVAAVHGSSASTVSRFSQAAAALEGQQVMDASREGERSVDEVTWVGGMNSMLTSGPSVDLSSASAMTCPPLDGNPFAEGKPKRSLSQRITRKISKMFMG
jgi:hypothetical protein